MDELWTAYLSDRSLANRDALILEIRKAVIAMVYKAFLCCNRREVDSEVSLRVVDLVHKAETPIDLEWLAKECRVAIQRRARKPHQEEKILREMTEAFGHTISEWRGT